MRARSQAFAGVVVLAALAGPFAPSSGAQGPAPIPTKLPTPPAAPGQVPAMAGLAPLPALTVKITFITVPSAKKVFVNWGKKRLGIIAPHQPLIIQRPRDSGPLDVIVTSEGYVPVQTRAYTFADTKVAVKLTPIEQKNTLLGYREAVPPPDAGVPLPPPGTPPVAATPGAPLAPGAPPPAPGRAPGYDAGAR